MSDGGLIVVDEFVAWLIELGIGQPLDRPPSRTIPSVWLMPRDGGIPAPRRGETMTITVVDTQLGSPSNLEPWLEETFIEVTTRAVTANAGRLVHRAIRGRIAPEHQPGGGRNYPMAGIDPVEYSTIWRNEQELPPVDQHYLRRSSYRLAVRGRVLRGETSP